MKIVTLWLSFSLILLSAIASDKPNILWLTLEDSSPQYFGCYGNSSAITPNIDALAGKGVRFTNAYSTATVCSPSRSGIITGLRNAITGNGHHRSTYGLPNNITGFPSFLKNAGYYTSNNYKEDYNTSAASRISSESWNESSSNAHYEKRTEGQPFFAIFNFNDSHQSRTMTEPYQWYMDNIFNKMPEAYKVKPEEVYVPPFYRDSREMRKHLARMQNSINYTDKQVGDHLADLERRGLTEETIIFIYADHGEGMPRGKGNGIGQGYKVPFIIYFPEKYAHLNPWGNEQIVDEIISFEDLAPTVLSLAGVSAPDYYRGRAFLGSERTTDDLTVFGGRDRLDDALDFSRAVMQDSFIYVRNFMSDRSEFQYAKYFDVGEISHAIRNDYWEGKLDHNQELLMNKPRAKECLYDLKNDPWELNNLADNVNYITIKEELAAKLKQEMLETRETHLIPEYQYPMLSVSPLEASNDDSILPIDTVLNVAWLCGEDESVIPQQIIALNSSIDLVRHWALVGLRLQDSTLLDAYESSITPLLSDSYLPNQVEAAYLLYWLFENAEAKTKLENYAKGSNRQLANAAVQNIVNLEARALEFQSTLEQVASSGDYFAKILAQTYLHYWTQRELYWSSGKAEDFMPYSTYTFDTNTHDDLGHNNLEGTASNITNDEVRGKVLFGSAPLAFTNNFFLPRDYSVTFWVKTDNNTGNQTFCQLADANEELAISVGTDANQKLSIFINDDIIASDIDYQTSTWQQISLVRWDDTYTLYVDGESVVIVTDELSPDITEGELSVSNDVYFDDVAIYHFPLTSARVYSSYTNELVLSAIPLTGIPTYCYKFDNNLEDAMGNLDLTNTNSSFGSDTERGFVLELDGQDAGLIVQENFLLSEAFSISCWIKSTVNTKWLSPLALGGTSPFMYLCPYASWQEGLYLVVDNVASRDFHYAGDNASFPVNEWQHIVVSYADGTWKMYLNGELTLSTSQAMTVHDIERLTVGGLAHKADGYFIGQLDELRVYEYELSAGEVLTDMTTDDTTTSLAKNIVKTDISFYPRTVEDQMQVDSNEEITHINIYDMHGRLVAVQQGNSTSYNMYLSQLTTGNYIAICHIATGNQDAFQFVKK